MKQIILILSISLFPLLSFSNDLLFECGKNSEGNFNGWKVHPMNVFDNISFSENEIEFYSQNGGDYTISFTRKIEDMVGYSTLFIDVNFEERNNCQINFANVYLSTDGQNWDAISNRADLYQVQKTNREMNYIFIKTVADVSFYHDGILSFNHVKVEGEYKTPEQEQVLKPINDEPIFHIFSYQKVINIETKSEGDYEVYITDIKGQIIHHVEKNGSSRIEADYPNGIYIISILQNNKILNSEKVYL